MNTKILRYVSSAIAIGFVVVLFVEFVGMYFNKTLPIPPASQSSNTIATAYTMGVEFETTQEKARDLGLLCFTAGNEACKKMLIRVETNPGLKEAFLQAKAANVRIVLSMDFYVAEGFVAIDSRASDEQTITFLTK